MRLENKILAIMLAALMTLSLSRAVRADDQKIVTVSFTIQDTLVMEMDSTNINLGTISPSGDKGVLEKTAAHKIKIKANRKWKLTAQAQDDFKDVSSGNIIPIKQFKVRKANDNYQAFPNKNAQVVVANGEVTTNQGTDISIDYQLEMGWDNPAGTFNTQIVYTVSVNP